ncbi:MAG: hypothetical protein WC898_02425 [Candidatus Paceibacterota bacterium]|jgi:prophage tail gpP-like protein
MSDVVAITIGDKQYSHFTSYSVSSGIYTAAGTFSITFPEKAAPEITTGKKCVITVDGATVLTGIVERREKRGSKQTAEMIVGGRDLMGLVVDYHIETFKTLRNKKLVDVAEYFLRQIDFIKSVNITYLDGADSLDIAQEYVQPVPGMKVFDLLSGIAAARGMHFYLRSNGSLVFGKPRGFGSETFFVWNTGENNCNYTEKGFVEDISQQYSRVTVTGQKQSDAFTGLKTINGKATVDDDEFPQFTKPLVVETQTAGETLSHQARMIIEQQRFDGWSLRYVLPGHSQKGNIWQPDTICAVDDYTIPYRGECLLYSRSFNMNKNSDGEAEKSTEIILGKMGLRV